MIVSRETGRFVCGSITGNSFVGTSIVDGEMIRSSVIGAPTSVAFWSAAAPKSVRLAVCNGLIAPTFASADAPSGGVMRTANAARSTDESKRRKTRLL
jgi:hypothetical protein